MNTPEGMTLDPCPFCGGEAEFERVGTPRQSCIVTCRNCGARHESSDENEHSGSSWNSRVAAAPTPPEQPARCHWPGCPHGEDCAHAKPGQPAAQGELTDEQIDDCLPLGIAPYSTLVGQAEIRRFARSVIAAYRAEVERLLKGEA